MASDVIWSKCDELNRPAFLDPEDSCWYYEEYFEGDYSCSTGNQLVSNFKIPPDAKMDRYRYKIKAIETFASLLIRTRFKTGSALAPAPTSKPRTCSQFDSRLDSVCELFHTNRPEVPVLYCFDAVEALEPVHHTPGASRKPELVIQNMTFDNSLVVPDLERIYVVDDLITTGGHFVAMKRLIQRSFPYVSVGGFFLAKRIYAPPPGHTPADDPWG